MEEELEHITFQNTASWGVQVTCVKVAHKDTDKPEIREDLHQCYKAGLYTLSGWQKYRKITTVMGKTNSTWRRLI